MTGHRLELCNRSGGSGLREHHRRVWQRDRTVQALNYHRRHIYRINFRLVLYIAYSIHCMHWSLKQSQIQYQHQKMQDKD